MTGKATKKPMTIEESLATGYRKRLDMATLEAAVTSNEELGGQVAGAAPGGGGEVPVVAGSPRSNGNAQHPQKALYKQRERSLKNLVGIYQSKLKEEQHPPSPSGRISPTSASIPPHQQ